MSEDERENIKDVVDHAFDKKRGTIQLDGEYSIEVLEEIIKCAKGE